MGFGRGWGVAGRRAGGGGFGWRNRYYAAGLPGRARFGGYDSPYGYPPAYRAADPDGERQALRSQAEALQSELEFIKKRLGDIEERAAAE